MSLTPLQDMIYRKGALDFKDKVIEALDKHYKKIDAVHDEFDTEKTKSYLSALKHAVEIVQKEQVK